MTSDNASLVVSRVMTFIRRQTLHFGK